MSPTAGPPAKSIAPLCHRLVRLERCAFFGEKDEWLPPYQQDDARVMCPPFAGKNYRAGGLLVLSINPGGGNDKEESPHHGDAKFYPLLHQFKRLKKDNDIENFYGQRFVPAFSEVAHDWKIHQQLSKVLQAAKRGFNDIGYCNFVPYRCRKQGSQKNPDTYPKNISDMDKIIPRCVSLYLKPLLAELKPSMVVAFGEQVRKYLERYWNGFPYKTVT